MGHNSRKCPTFNMSDSVSPGFKLFGVHLTMSAAATSDIKRSCSADHFSHSSPLSSHTSSDVSLPGNTSKFSTGHLPGLNRHPQRRKRGVSWTEDEHRKFLAGLLKLGKGDWKGIAKQFVQSRTPTQVASHAQKYFLKQNILKKKRKTPCLFRMQTESIEKDNLNALRSTHEHASNSSEALWIKYGNQYLSEAFIRKSLYLQSPMSRLLVSNWLYNPNGMSTYSKCSYYLKPAIIEAEPNLELALSVAAPNKEIQKHVNSLERDLNFKYCKDNIG